MTGISKYENKEEFNNKNSGKGFPPFNSEL